MKKIIALAFVSAFLLIGSNVSAATCEVKAVCMDSMRVGIQTEDCKIISADEFSKQFSAAFGGDPNTTAECYIGCKDGECIKDNTSYVCTDTDGGKDYFTKGNIKLKGNGEQASASDVCSDKDNLSETSCLYEAGRYHIDTVSYKCPNGCLNGACVKTANGGTGSTCTDSDGGKDIFKAGIITINGKALDLGDTCGFGPQTIEEKYCLPDGTYSTEEMECPGLCELDSNVRAYCTKTCTKSFGYYCHETADGKTGIAFLTKDCKWEKAAPCQSNACGFTCQSYGTLIDTDGDGLLDINETKWGTDPKKFDTDGDGYGDMTEIYGGYNPVGDGKLTPAQVTLAGQMTAAENAAAANNQTAASSSDVANSTITDAMAPAATATIDTDISQAMEDSVGYFIAALVFLVVLLYVYGSLCLQLIATKLGIGGLWMAWVPIANIFLIFKCAGRPYWWFLLLFIPIVNIFVTIIPWLDVTEKLGKSKWLGLLMIISPINLIFMGYLAFSNSYPAYPTDNPINPAGGSDNYPQPIS